MKHIRKTIAAIASAGALLVPLTSNAAAVGFALTIDDATNTVTSSLAGVTITTLGIQQWRINFAGALSGISGPAVDMSWTSGADDTGVNWLRRESGFDFLLSGDTTLPGSTGDLCGSTLSPLTQGITCRIGFTSADTYFITVLDPTPVAVSSPATVALAGLGLLAAAGASRRRR